MSNRVYKPGTVITVHDSMQTGYQYKLLAPPGEKFAPGFKPHFSPKKMLELGVFEGKYCNDCADEFPDDWFESAKISAVPDESLNAFSVKSRQSLQHWQQKGWIVEPDPRGWFQWYCRYYMGRRLDGEDARQIRRWKAIRRHIGQIRANCERGDIFCRPRQRQALLHWAYDSRKI